MKSKKPVGDLEPSEDNKDTKSEEKASSEEDEDRAEVVPLQPKAKVTHYLNNCEHMDFCSHCSHSFRNHDYESDYL